MMKVTSRSGAHFAAKPTVVHRKRHTEPILQRVGFRRIELSTGTRMTAMTTEAVIAKVLV
jgi:hypothetical protein